MSGPGISSGSRGVSERLSSARGALAPSRVSEALGWLLGLAVWSAAVVAHLWLFGALS